MSDPTTRPESPSVLDTGLVLGTLAVIGGVMAGLMFVAIPQPNLPVLAGTLGALLGTILGGYAGYRWGASQATKASPPAGTMTATLSATSEAPAEGGAS